VSSTAFNAAKARTKYSCSIWVDAFLRDTLDLEADEFGAYHLLLYAMWSRESCDLPDDDRKLCRIARSSPQIWKRRIRASLERFFDVENGLWISKRLRLEADKTERFLRSQSERKTGPDQKNRVTSENGVAKLQNSEQENKSSKSLKTNALTSTTDTTTDPSGEYPTQVTKIPNIKEEGGGGSACAREAGILPPENPTFRERILTAMGVDVCGLTGRGGQTLGQEADMARAMRWVALPGLTEDLVVAEIESLMQRKRDGPPSTFSYFDKPMSRLSGALTAPPLQPAQPTRTGGSQHDRARFDTAHREYVRRLANGEIDRGPDPSDPFAGR